MLPLGIGTGQENPKLVYSFLEKFCLDCHDSETEKGEREFESLDFPLKNLADLIRVQEIIDQVTVKEMPPPKKKSIQPSDEERVAVLRALRESVAAARGKIESDGARTVIRRLSNREYENTLAVLFGRRVDTLGLTADFPKENTSHHMDNIGESLVTSGFLLDQYFHSAQKLIEYRLGRQGMKPKTWHFNKYFVQYEELSGPHRAAFNYRYLCLYEQPNTDTRQGGYGHIEDFLEGVPESGFYQIDVKAQAMHRDTHYDPDIFKIDFSEPFLLGIVPGDATKGHIHYPQGIEPLLAQSTVPDKKPEWLKFKVWLETGQTPRFIFPNGPYESRASVMAVNRKYKKEFKGNIKGGVSRTHILRQGALPHIRISEIKIHGPLPEMDGIREELAVFGKNGFQTSRALDQLYQFGERAFRRPLTDRDRARIKNTYQTRIGEKATPRQAALDTLKMILCSPSFLYLSEITAEKEKQLGTYDLASRLSYALWAAPPDAPLLASAASGKLKKREEIFRQSLRLLQDEKVSGFVNAFLDSWLNLRELGGMPPPRRAARVYYYENLPESMKEEARLFFRHLLHENRPVTDFLHADYTFVDKKLANLYGLPEGKKLRLADGFKKVSIAGNRQRGGLLGMAAVLTVSANGVETSPVTRGVWVSENILGVIPPPPPDDVPPIEPDVRGAKSIRERLEKHREIKTCGECHRKIDPLGFGLESFDPIGRWRTRYPRGKETGKGPEIDSSGKFPSGETFANFDEFRATLAAHRKDVFTRNLITKMLTYSTGRHMESIDQYEIGDILENVRKEGYGFRALVLEVLGSEIFRSR